MSKDKQKPMTKEQRAEFSKADVEFRGLCDKYSDFKFVGNTVVNLYLIGKRNLKREGCIYTDEEDQSKSLFAGGTGYIIYRNVFKGSKE